jgi:hypothetical protein
MEAEASLAAKDPAPATFMASSQVASRSSYLMNFELEEEGTGQRGERRSVMTVWFARCLEVLCKESLQRMNPGMLSCMISWIDSMRVDCNKNGFKSIVEDEAMASLMSLPHDEAALKRMKDGWCEYGSGRYSVAVNMMDDILNS